MEEDAKALGILHKKKQRDNRPQVMYIAEEDLNLLREVVVEVAESTLGNITCNQTNWATLLSAQVTRLEEVVTEVQDTVQAETYSVDPSDTLATPMMPLPFSIDMPA